MLTGTNGQRARHLDPLGEPERQVNRRLRRQMVGPPIPGKLLAAVVLMGRERFTKPAVGTPGGLAFWFDIGGTQGLSCLKIMP